MSTISRLFKSKPRTLNQLKQIHALYITTGLFKSPSNLAKLIEHSFILKPCQNPNYAHLIFTYSTSHKTFLLNNLIKLSSPKHSIFLFANWVSRSSLAFDDYTFIFALGACARLPCLSSLYEGKQIHCLIIKVGFVLDLLVSTTAIHFYASNGKMCFARKVFDEMSLRSTPTWNALITGYSSQKRECDDNAVKALVCFKDMLVVGDSEVKPSCTTMTCVLAAASQLGSLEIGMCVHGFVVKMVDAVENDVFVGTGLVDMYAKCGCLEIASDVFGMMKERNVLTWTALTTGMAFHGKGNNAIDMLKEMKRCNVMPNVVTFTSVLTACCHAGLVEEGLHLFHHMKNEFGVTPLIEHYGCIVDLLGKAGHLIEAYDFIVRMRIKPDPVLWRSLLSSCRLHGDLIMGDRVGKVLLQLQKDTFPGDLSTPSQDYIGLANVYALANRWDDVGTVRGEMKTKGLEIKPGRSAVH